MMKYEKKKKKKGGGEKTYMYSIHTYTRRQGGFPRQFVWSFVFIG